MYSLISNNISAVLKSIDKKRDIDPYVQMLQMFQDGCVAINQGYQNVYRKYWQLNAAKLSPEFCSFYFQVMDELRNEINLDILIIVNKLYKVSSNLKGRQTIQFSFATKLLHTIDNTLPVYDSMVSDFYFLPQIKSNWNKEKKLDKYLQSYNFLIKEHKRVLDEKLLSEAITSFRDYFDLRESYTDHKIVDTILWKFTSYMRSGALIKGGIKYR